MLKEQEMYDEVINFIRDEETKGNNNTEPKAMVNTLVRMSKQIGGYPNSVFKFLVLLIRCSDEDLFIQSFLDFYPVISFTKDMNTYKSEVVERIGHSGAKILSIDIKAKWVEKNKKYSVAEDTKTNKMLILIQHYKDIFIEGAKSVDMIKSISEWGQLLDNEAFMNVYSYNLKMSIKGYKSCVNYILMAQEIAHTPALSYAQLHKVAYACEQLQSLAHDFIVTVETYGYFLVDNGIEQADLFGSADIYGKKNIERIHKNLMEIEKPNNKDYYCNDDDLNNFDTSNNLRSEETKDSLFNRPPINSKIFDIDEFS